MNKEERQMRAKHENVVLICACITTPLIIPDNRIGKCSECGSQVQFRPHAPAGRMMCTRCAYDLIDFNDPDLKIEILPRMLEDVLTYFKRQGN
jgi:hypothetical protein